MNIPNLIVILIIGWAVGVFAYNLFKQRPAFVCRFCGKYFFSQQKLNTHQMDICNNQYMNNYVLSEKERKEKNIGLIIE